MKEKIMELFSKVCETKMPRRVFYDWVELMALAISTSSKACSKTVFEYRVKRMEEIRMRYSQEDIKHFAEMFNLLRLELKRTMDDVLGGIFTSAKIQDKEIGQIFTPPHTADLSAEIAFQRLFSKECIFEPCCGSGAFCLGSIRYLHKTGYDYKNNAIFKAQDIDENCVRMTYVQLALLGVKGYVYQGNFVEDNPLIETLCYITPELARAIRQGTIEI